MSDIWKMRPGSGKNLWKVIVFVDDGLNPGLQTRHILATTMTEAIASAELVTRKNLEPLNVSVTAVVVELVDGLGVVK